MSISSIKKVLLAGTALVAVAAFSQQAKAATQVLTGPGTWASAGTFGGTNLGDASDAAATNAVTLGGFALTVTNNGTAADTAATFNTFTLGAVDNNTGTGAINVTQSALGTAPANPLAVTISTVTNTGGTAGTMTILSNNAAETAGVGQNVTVGITTSLALGGALTITNGDTTSTGSTTSLTVGTTTTVGGITTLTGGAAAGDHAMLTNLQE